MLGQPIKVCFPIVGDEVGGCHISALKLISNLVRSKTDPLIVLKKSDGVLAEDTRREGMNL